jgi:hypothetical protein
LTSGVFLAGCGLEADEVAVEAEVGSRVHPLFDASGTTTAPFPSDLFTVDDAENNTGRRVNLPYPDCAARPSDCDDITEINQLDGFGLQPRLAVPFDDAIDPATVTSDTVFVVDLGDTVDPLLPPAGPVGINQRVWDVATNTLYVEVDALLDQHHRYGLIITDGVRDVDGQPVLALPAFRRLADLDHEEDPIEHEWYRTGIQQALAAASGRVNPAHVAAASVFTTQSVTSVMQRVRDQVLAAEVQPARFDLLPDGGRAVFELAKISSIQHRQQTNVAPGFTNVNVDLAQLRIVSGAVARVAHGSYQSPRYMVPGEYIPAVKTAAGTPSPF